MDPLLDHVHLGHKVVLDRFDRRCLERLIVELLFGFHDPNDRSVKIMFSVRVNVRLRAFRFLGLRDADTSAGMCEVQEGPTTYRILCLDRIDVDLCPRVRKVGIEVEHVVFVDVFPYGPFLEDFFIRTCQTLKGPFKFGLVWFGVVQRQFLFSLVSKRIMSHPFWWPPGWPCTQSLFRH